MENDRSSGGRSSGSSSNRQSGTQKDEELELLLDALMPRLVTRMQRALEHVKPVSAAAAQLSSSQYISASSATCSSSSSFDSTDSSVSSPATDVDVLVQRSVTDALQQLFTLLLHPNSSHDGGEAADGHSEEVSVGDGSSGAEYVAMPSMQLLGAVNYHAGSTVTVGQQVMKVWSVKNNGDTQWPEQVHLLPATSTAAVSATTAQYSLESDVILFTDLSPGDTMNVSVLITAPPVAGRHVAHYQLAFCQPADKQWVRFGDELTIDLVCQQPTASSSATSIPAAAAASATSSSATSAAADKANTSTTEQPTASRKTSNEETKHSSDSIDSSDSSLDTSSISELVPSNTTRRPLSRSGDVAAEEEKERREERGKKDKLRVERGKDRSQSVDSKPPVLSTNDWWGLVSADAVRATAGGSPQPQPSALGGATAPPRMPTIQSPSHLMSFESTGATAEDEQALDWLNYASAVPPTATAAPTTAAAASAPSAARNLSAITGLHLTSSRSANHSRSNSPALPPSTFTATSVPMFARSTSQSFPPVPTGSTANGELLSPPLTPTIPAGSLLSKDDLMSWAGGQGLMTTNKQTGVQSATHTAAQQQQQLPTISTSGSATSAAVGPPAAPLGSSQSSLSHSHGTLPRQPTSSLSPNGSRSRHSMPPTARIALPSSASAFNLSSQQQQQQQQQSSGGSGGGGGSTAGTQSNIPDFLKEETARLSNGKQ